MESVPPMPPLPRHPLLGYALIAAAAFLAGMAIEQWAPPPAGHASRIAWPAASERP